jgi:hypothetical protein
LPKVVEIQELPLHILTILILVHVLLGLSEFESALVRLSAVGHSRRRDERKRLSGTEAFLTHLTISKLRDERAAHDR